MTMEATEIRGVRKRPALFRALGDDDPPGIVTVGGAEYKFDALCKHDSWAATAIYCGPSGERIICKFNRRQPIFGLPMAWLGRRLAAREAEFLRRLADVELVPEELGPVVADGRRLSNAVARRYVDGEVFRSREQVDAGFFAEWGELFATLHARNMAYVDSHKRENVIVDRDGRPHLIDFQISVGLAPRWSGSGRIARYILARLQEIDMYHYRKHYARCLGDTLTPEERARYLEPPPFIRWHRRFAVPVRQARRRLLALLKIRDRSGMARSEREPEDAFR